VFRAIAFPRDEVSLPTSSATAVKNAIDDVFQAIWHCNWARLFMGMTREKCGIIVMPRMQEGGVEGGKDGHIRQQIESIYRSIGLDLSNSVWPTVANHKLHNTAITFMHVVTGTMKGGEEDLIPHLVVKTRHSS
jgi:hypothetical protein